MSTLALGVLIIFAVATATFYVAGTVPGSAWAKDVCALSRTFCAHPGWAAMATGGVALIYLALRSMRL